MTTPPPSADAAAPVAQPARAELSGDRRRCCSGRGDCSGQGLGGGEAQADAPPPANVTVSTPLQRSIVEWDDYIGRFEASQSVEMRPRVSGQLVGVHFRDGDIVRKGQLLFTIDPRPFLAALAEARARRRRRADRSCALAEANYAPRRAAGRRRSGLAGGGRLAARRGPLGRGAASPPRRRVVRQRALDVEFTQVRAPITGRISDRRIDVGNLVAGDGETDADHDLRARPDLLHLRRLGGALPEDDARAAGDRAPAQTVEIRLQDEADYSWRGRVDFTDNGIDPAFGHDPRPRGDRQSRPISWRPACSATCGWPRAATARRFARPRRRGADRSGAQDRAGRRQGRHGRGRPVELGPLVGSLRSIRSGLQPDRPRGHPGRPVRACPARR